MLSLAIGTCYAYVVIRSALCVDIALIGHFVAVWRNVMNGVLCYVFKR